MTMRMLLLAAAYAMADGMIRNPRKEVDDTQT